MKPVIKVVIMRQNQEFESDWYYSHTVRDLKAQISEKINVPADNQILTFMNGSQLFDLCTRSDFREITEDGFRIRLILATDTVTLQLLCGDKKINIHPKLGMSVQDMKAEMIPCIEMMFPEDRGVRGEYADLRSFDLFEGSGKWLQDEDKVVDANLRDGDEVHVVKRISVEVTVNGSALIRVLTNRLFTLVDFQGELCRTLGIPFNAIFQLATRDGLLNMNDRNNTLFMYGVDVGSMIFVTFPPPPTPRPRP